jgi:hypothetical protein
MLYVFELMGLIREAFFSSVLENILFCFHLKIERAVDSKLNFK